VKYLSVKYLKIIFLNYFSEKPTARETYLFAPCIPWNRTHGDTKFNQQPTHGKHIYMYIKGDQSATLMKGFC